MPKKYTSAKMHEGTFAVGVGAISREITTHPDSTNKSVESITFDETTNLVTLVIKDKVGKKVVLDVPVSNFENLRE